MKIYNIIILIYILFFIKLYNCLNHVILDPNVNFMMQWELYENEKFINIILSAESQVWLGIGWGNGGSMENSDYAVTVFNENGTVSIADMYMKNKRPPPIPDSITSGCKDDLILNHAFQTPSFTFVNFTKYYNYIDPCDKELLIDKTMYFIWARGESNDFIEHSKSNSGVVAVRLNSKNQFNYIQWHAAFLFIGFSILMPIGILIARYFKQYNYWWPLHYTIQIGACISILTGIIIGFVMNDGFHTTLHSVLGLITFIFTVFVVILGYLSHYFYKPTRTSIPLTDKIHWFSGRFVFMFSWITIITGLVQYNLDALAWVFAILILFIISIVIFLEQYKRRYQLIENINLIKMNDNDLDNNNSSFNNDDNNNNNNSNNHLKNNNNNNNNINNKIVVSLDKHYDNEESNNLVDEEF